MPVTDLVVAVAQHEQHGEAFDAAAQALQQFERGRVGPVDALELQHGRPGSVAQFVEQATEQFAALAVPAQQRAHPRAQIARRVVEGPQRARREQGLAPLHQIHRGLQAALGAFSPGARGAVTLPLALRGLNR